MGLRGAAGSFLSRLYSSHVEVPTIPARCRLAAAVAPVRKEVRAAGSLVNPARWAREDRASRDHQAQAAAEARA